MQYIRCNFSKRCTNSNLQVKTEDHTIRKITQFNYLGSIIQNGEEIDGDVSHRIQTGLTKWISTSGVIYDRKVPLDLKEKFYHIDLRCCIGSNIE